jgi:Domain of unknown function (DUF4845)
MKKSQSGISLFGVLFWLIIIGFGFLLGMKIGPTYAEFMDVKKGLNRARDAGSTVASARGAFDTFASAGYVTSVSGKDLVITKNGDKVVVAVEYQKKLPLFGPVSLVIDYAATSD